MNPGKLLLVLVAPSAGTAGTVVFTLQGRIQGRGTCVMQKRHHLVHLGLDPAFRGLGVLVRLFLHCFEVNRCVI